MTRPQSDINAEIELYRPEGEARVRRIERMFAIFEEVARREMEGNADPREDETLLTIIARSIGRTMKNENFHARARDVLESLRSGNCAVPTPTAIVDKAVTIAKLRTFVRSARRIVQHFASANPKQIWGGHEIDPLGAHGWIEAERTEVGTNRDGGDPKVEKAAS